MLNDEKKRYYYLDALKGIAILLVIVYHTTIFMVHGATDFLYKMTGEGARGVQLFYIISAFTIFISLYKSSFSGKQIEKLKFFLKRFFRIVPLFYFMIIIFSLAVLIFFPSWKQLLHLDINPVSLISSITFTNNFIPQYMNAVVPGQWFIAVQMFFYIMIPILFLRIKNLTTAKKYFLWSLGIASLIELVLPLFFAEAISIDVKTFLFYTVPIQLPTFILGILAFFILFNKDENKPISYIKEFIFLFGATCVFEIVFLVSRLLITHNIDTSLITPRIYIESVCFLGLILLLSKGYLLFLQNKILQYIGKISYSIYLVHFICFIIITKNNLYPQIASYFTNDYKEFLFLFLMTSILSVGIATLTFRYIELPAEKLGKYLSEKILGHFNGLTK